MKRARQIKSAKQILQKYFFEYLIPPDNDDAAHPLQADQWARIVGEKVAEHSRPLCVEEGTLVIESEHALWNHYILLNSNRIIAAMWRLNKIFVKSIKLKLTRSGGV